MMPAFDDERYGYSKRQVDEYVDYVLEENKRIVLTNTQLFLLWITELEKTPDNSFNNIGLQQAQLSELLRESREHIYQQLSKIEKPAEAETTVIQQTKRSSFRSSVTGAIFYVVLAVLVLGVYLFGMENPTGPPQNLAGFSAMTVLTRSMQDVIPQNSLIITRQVDPAMIQIGDDITYLMPNNTTITHRVVAVHPNYRDTGEFGFETQGTMNARADAEIVLAPNIVGRVFFHNLFLGNTILFIRAHVLFIGILAALGTALIVVLHKLIFKESEKGDSMEPTGKESRRKNSKC